MKVWDIVTLKDIRNFHKQKRVEGARREINKFFSNLETRGTIIENRAYLMVYNKRSPEKSYILVDRI
jgi:hypothetical protein